MKLMTWVLIGAGLIFVALAAAFLLLLRRILSGTKSGTGPADWGSHFQRAGYQPLARMPDPREYEFAGSRLRIPNQQLEALRTERRKIIRRYLHHLSREFGRVTLGIREIVAASPADQAHLASALMRQRTSFLAAMVVAEARLGLHACGFETLDLEHLVHPLEAMGSDLGRLSELAKLPVV